MNPVLAIAASGMATASLRLAVSASNVANMSDTGPLNDANAVNAGQFPVAYTPLHADQIDVAGGGTAATVTTVNPSYLPMYDPNAPYADKNGMIATPNVDLTSEILQQIIASYIFAANAKVMQVGSQMAGTLLSITA
jgi:flagellar basal-body rod protein FlgC